MACHCASVYGLVTRGVSLIAPHRHGEVEVDLARLDQAGDRRGRHRLGAGGQRDMPLARHQAGGGVQPDPAGAGQVDLGPGVQVGEVGGRPFRPLQRLHVGDELDQVAGDEARGVAEVAQQLHQQPGGVPAGAAGARPASPPASRRPAPCGRCRRSALCTMRFSATSMSTVRCAPRGTSASSAASSGPGRLGAAERRQLLFQHRVVGERPGLRLRLQEEVERVDGRHVGDEVDRHLEIGDPLGEHDAGEEIALRVLLPVEEMRLRRHRQRVGERSGVRACGAGRRRMVCGPSETGAVVAVAGAVGQRGVDRHAQPGVVKRRGSRVARTGPSAPGSRPAIRSATSRPAAGEVWMP